MDFILAIDDGPCFEQVFRSMMVATAQHFKQAGIKRPLPKQLKKQKTAAG